MRAFKDCHPIVNLIYFLAVIGFSVVFMHPACIAISLFCALTYSIILRGRRAVILSLGMMLPLFVLTALLNPVFNHAGATVLAYLPDGNPLTLESLLFGLCSAGMLVSVICIFSCFGSVVSGEKFIYLFGRVLPSIALLIKMAFRFVPLFAREIKEVSDAQKGIGKGEGASLLQKAHSGVSVLSVMITKSLENAVETASSMKSRGYGSGKRTAFSNYKFSSSDGTVLGTVVLLFALVLFGALVGENSAQFFPKIKITPITWENAEFFIAYFILSALPIIIEIKEVWRWKKSR